MSKIQNSIIKCIETGVFPKSVYKYRELDDNTKLSLENAEFWFAQPKTFNDPFDCDLSEAIPKNTKDFKAHLISLKVNSVDVNKKVKAAKKDLRLIQKLAFDSRRKVINRHGILSLSKVYDNILMWSHYASNHTGVVIAFDMSLDLDFFISPLNIKYQDTYKELNYFANPLDTIEKNNSIKSSLWKYEEEIRIIKDKFGLHPIKRDAVRKIYFGCKTSKLKINEFMMLCKNSGYKHMKYYQGKIVHGAFKLSFYQLK